MTKETRRLTVKNKVFTKADVQRLARFFSSEYEAVRDSEQSSAHYCALTFQVDCADGTSYESESVELLEDEGPIDIKKTNSLQMTLHTLDQKVDFSIREGRYSEGSLIVRGCDKHWVNGTFSTLEDIIDSVKPQDNWILRHRTSSLHLIALGTGSLIFLLLDALVYPHIPPIENPSDSIQALRDYIWATPWFAFLFAWFLRWFMGISVLAFHLRSWLLDLWPQIEFDFGPEHMNLEVARRAKVVAVFSIVIIPIAIAIVPDILNTLTIGFP